MSSFQFLQLFCVAVFFVSKSFCVSVSLELNANTLREELDSVKGIVAEVITDLRKINDVISTFDAELKSVKQMVESNCPLKGRTSEIQSKKQIKKRTRRGADSSPRQPGATVAFYARVKEILADLNDNQVIPFVNVITDTHSAFNGTTFTCPESGYYYFSVSLLAYPDVQVEVNLKLNGVWFAALYTKGFRLHYNTDVYAHGTSGGLVHLNANDQVWVQVNGNNHFGTGNMLYHQYSTFSGFKV